MKNIFSLNLDPFQKARVRLTLWYILISAFLLIVFSVAAIGAEQKAFSRIQQVLSNKTQRPKLTALLEERLSQFENDFLRRLLFFDLVLFLVASTSSYFLSGRTLKPIQIMIKQQEEFSADASHELRTPLTTINMEIEAFKRTEKNLPQKYNDLLISIKEEINRMKGIVDGLLIFVRSSYVDTNKSWKTVNLSSLADDTYKQMQELAKEKKINFILQNTPDVYTLGNSDQLKQVLIILLDNAIKFTPRQGSVTLKTKKGSQLIIEDTGIGITKEELPYIFKRFYRASNNLDQNKGVGIGLAIAQKIVENHKGKITVESTPKKGCTFIITLPSVS